MPLFLEDLEGQTYTALASAVALRYKNIAMSTIFFVVLRKEQIKVLWNTNRKSYVIHRTVTSDGHLS